MAKRFRKYFKQCKGKRAEGDKHGKVIVKGIECEGKRGKHCPAGVPSQCGAWAIDFRHPDGRWVSKVYPEIKTKTEAEHYLSIIKTDILRNKFNLPCGRAIPTLKEYSKCYMESHRGAKENTLKMKQRAINALVAVLGDYPLNKITPFIIEKYRLERKEKGIKDSSINLDVSILSNVFATAIKAGIVDKNPCKEVRRLKAMQTRDRVLSQPEITLLLDKLHGKDRLMVLVGLFSGLRLGGVLGLCWYDIDFTRKIISSSHKTGKLVSIPLSDYLEGELKRYKGFPSSGDRVFEVREITNAVVAEYSNHFSKLFKGLGIQDFTFHNLRHTFASLLQGELGIGAVVVQGMTGHSSLGMLQKYSHTGLDNKQKAIKSLTEYVIMGSQKTCLAIAQ